MPRLCRLVRVSYCVVAMTCVAMLLVPILAAHFLAGIILEASGVAADTLGSIGEWLGECSDGP